MSIDIQGCKHEDFWEAIDWSYHNHIVREIQEGIYQAAKKNKRKKVKELQDCLVESRSAILLAVKRVTQEKKSRYSAGVDRNTYLTSVSRIQLVNQVTQINLDTYQPLPALRKYIHQRNGKKRPIGILSVTDRILQTLVKMAMEPEWETKFEPNSYGFRQGRCCRDAIMKIQNVINDADGNTSGYWILKADIKDCFDNINHDLVIRTITNFKLVISRWMKAGIIKSGMFIETKKGILQGGVLSPLLSNIALDGMERLFQTDLQRKLRPFSIKRGEITDKITLIRYADDFVFFSHSKEDILKNYLPKLTRFLTDRGLTMNKEKTKIIHCSQGFDFLGFRIRKIVKSGKNFCLISPTKKTVKRFLTNIKRILIFNKWATGEILKKKLNLAIRGWIMHYRISNNTKIFRYIDNCIYKILWDWCKRRHPEKSNVWIIHRYFRKTGNNIWSFGGNRNFPLILTSEIALK